MRKQVRVIVALFIGVVESLLVVVVWFVEHLRSWEEAPGLPSAAPIPVLLGPPDAGSAFWTAWALNSLWWAVFAFGVLSTIDSAGRRSEKKSRVA
jgi:hypothetical protein